LLGDALRSLRKQRDPQAALALLDEHARRFPDTVLTPEVAMLRAEALLGLGRNVEALSQLDRLTLASMPNQGERFVLRGELRAAAGRWSEALDDFDKALASALALGLDSRAREVKERALWGRGSARSHVGDVAGSRADLAEYLRTFPEGRFARRAAQWMEVTK
jgi:tetratricopeptide (TPR) repeat protein